MLSIIIIISIALLVAATAFLSSTGKLIDRRRKMLNFVTFRGWVIIGMNLGIIILSVLQYYFNEREIKEKEKAALIFQKNRDSVLKSNYDSSLYVLKNKFDTSNINTVLTVTQTLGKYGYMLDSAQNKLIKIIKDSSKTKVIIGEDPVFELCDPNGIALREVKHNSYILDFAYCSNGAASTDYNITFYYGMSDSFSGTLFAIDSLKLESTMNISNGSGNIEHLEIPTTLNNFSFFFIYFKGKYMNMEKTKTYSLDNLYYFNRKANTIGLVSRGSKNRIIKLLLAK